MDGVFAVAADNFTARSRRCTDRSNMGISRQRLIGDLDNDAPAEGSRDVDGQVAAFLITRRYAIALRRGSSFSAGQRLTIITVPCDAMG